jgi:hypothetical protein
MTTAKECFDLIAKMDMMDIKVLGAETSQKTYIYMYLTRALKELAHVARVVKIAEPLNIVSDDYQSFTISGQPIDMYAPLRLLDNTDYSANNRSSFAHPMGWYREGSNQQIHTKGLNGTYILHYVAHPKSVTVATENEPVEFPEQGIMCLLYWTIGLIKESRNAFAEAQSMFDKANQRIKLTILANESAKGRGSDGYIPSVNDVNTYFKF